MHSGYKNCNKIASGQGYISLSNHILFKKGTFWPITSKSCNIAFNFQEYFIMLVADVLHGGFCGESLDALQISLHGLYTVPCKKTRFLAVYEAKWGLFKLK